MSWLIRRVLGSLLMVWVVISVVFVAVRMVPGDPAELLLSQGGASPDPATVRALHTQLGLDQPLSAQYVSQFRGLLHGDLGKSLQDGSPTAGEILRRLPRTLELILVAAIAALVTGLPAGMLAALDRGGIPGRLLSWIAALALALPVFVIGPGISLVFAQRLHWVPTGGYVPLSEAPGRHFALLAMPAATIAAGLFATVFRVTRASVLDVAARDYVRTARAKGVPGWRILRSHILHNALIPVVTAVTLNLGSLLGGTVLVEYVFSYPGLSGMLVEAVNARDYPTVEGTVLVIAVLFVLLNLAMDMVHSLLDPRMRRA